MALYELDGNRLVPARVGTAAAPSLHEAGLAAARRQIVEVLRRPLLTVSEESFDGAQVVTALDAAGHVVTLAVVDSLDSTTLLTLMARSTAARSSGRAGLARNYPGGAAALEAHEESLRRAVPSSDGSGAVLTILAGAVAPEVRASVAMLGASGVELHGVDVREVEGGRILVAIERLEHDSLGTTTPLIVDSGRRSRRALRAQTATASSSPDAVTAPTPVQQPVPAAEPDRSKPEPDGAAGPGAEAPAAARRGAHAGPAIADEGSAGPDQEVTAPARLFSQTDPAPETGAEADPTLEAEAEAEEDPAPEPEVAADAATSSADTAGAHRAHRSEAPVLGATPLVPTGEGAQGELARVAATLDGPVTLVWRRLRRGIHHEAVLRPDGTITLADGRVFRDPSAAANAAQHTVDVDGWRVWREGEHGPSLGELVSRQDAE